MLKRMTLAALMLAPFAVLAAQNSLQVTINSVEVRDDGHHSIFIDGTVPDEGCSLQDRAVIFNQPELLLTALTAFTSGDLVVIQVDTCIENAAGATTQAPKATKVRLFAP